MLWNNIKVIILDCKNNKSSENEWRSEENTEIVFSELVVEFDEQDNCYEMISKL